MPATDNSTVQITINVVDGNSGQVINSVVKNLDNLGTAGAGNGQKVASGLNEAGAAGVKAGKDIGNGMKEAGAHSLSALDNVRLLRDDLGVRIPRAMEKVISQSKLAMGAITAIGGGLVALGSIEVLARIGVQLYDLYKRFLDTGSQVDEFNRKLGETASQKFFDVASIEDVNANLAKTNQLMGQLNAKRINSISTFSLLARGATGLVNGNLGDAIGAYNLQYFNTGDAKNQNRAQAQNDEDRRREAKEEHEVRLQEIKDNRDRAAALQGVAAQQAELNAKIAEARENRRYTRNVSEIELDVQNRANGKFAGQPGYLSLDPNAGAEREQREITSASAQTAGKNAVLARQNIEETRRLQAEAQTAALRGEAIYEAQRIEQERQIKLKITETLLSASEGEKQLAAIREKYAQDRLRRIEQEQAETDRLKLEANTAGLTGLAHVEATRQAQLAGLAKEIPNFAKDDTGSQRRAAINEQSLREGAKEQEQFNERLAQLDAARSDRYESENARIQSSADRTVTEITKAWREMYGQLGALDQRRIQSYQALQEELTKIQQDADRQKVISRQRLENQTLKAEESAARLGQNPERERTQTILDEYNERMRQLEELRAQDADNADLYRRQEIAAEQEKNGKLLDQRRQLRDKLAGELRGFFSNPIEALRRQGEEAASKIAADFLLKLRPIGGLSGGYGDPGIGGRHGGIFSSITGLSSGRSNITASSSTVQASTATIYVQSATIAGGFSGGGSGASFGRSSTGFSGTPSGFGGDAGSSTSTAAAGNSGGAGIPYANAPWTSASTGDLGILSTASNTVQSVKGMGQDAAALMKQLGMNNLANLSVTQKLGGFGKFLGSDKAAGALGGAMGLFSAFQGNGGIGGALSGAFSGARLGGQIGGPIGAAIGAIAGGVVGLFGFGGRSKAEHYDHHEVQPRMKNDLQAYEAGSMDYQTAYDDLDSLSRDAKITTRQWGSGGKGYYNDNIKPELENAQQRLTREQKAGRSEFGMTAAQFHSGGWIGGFGSMATDSDTGWVHAQRGEYVMHQQGTITHSTALELMRAGASSADMAAYYGATSKAPTASNNPVNLQFVSHDAKGAYQLFMDNAHHIRAALNQSYAENSGGSDFA